MYIFAYEYICFEKPVFVSTFLPFCPVSFWSQLVYASDGVESHFYLSGIGVATLQSRPRLHWHLIGLIGADRRASTP